MTWNYIVANNPNATILGGFGVNQGSGNGGLTASTDALTISYGDACFIYDFEPFRATPGTASATTGPSLNIIASRPSALRVDSITLDRYDI
jgi:hypothetical protein